MTRWHTVSFSFETTAALEPPWKRQAWLPADAVPVGNDSPNDGYALYPIEPQWDVEGGIAYQDPATGVTITHFPAANDTIAPALADIRLWYPKEKDLVAIASDLISLSARRLSTGPNSPDFLVF
jgi:hypothetical protein